MHLRRQSTSRSCLVGVGLPALAVLVALALSTASTAAPPEKEPAPPPLPIFHVIEGVDLARLTWGAPFAPHAGPWCALSALVSGTHPDVRAWDLRGALSTFAGRNRVGAATLFLDGFGPPATVRLVELATLEAGDERNCWNLVDSSQVRPFPPVFFKWIHDKKALYVGSLEVEAFSQVLLMAHFTSADAFRKAARHDLSYTQLFNEPERYRGEVVALRGRLKKVTRLDAPDDVRAQGVPFIYEAWIFYDVYGENPFCAVFTDLPSGLKVEGEQKIDAEVAFDGYFYKRYRYKAFDTKKPNQFRDAPLLIGHTMKLLSPPELAGQAGAADNWGQHLIWVFLGLVGSAVAAVAALTWWFRHSDRRVRHRLEATRHTGFVPPPAGDETFSELER